MAHSDQCDALDRARTGKRRSRGTVRWRRIGVCHRRRPPMTGPTTVGDSTRRFIAGVTLHRRCDNRRPRPHLFFLLVPPVCGPNTAIQPSWGHSVLVTVEDFIHFNTNPLSRLSLQENVFVKELRMSQWMENKKSPNVKCGWLDYSDAIHTSRLTANAASLFPAHK